MSAKNVLIIDPSQDWQNIVMGLLRPMSAEMRFHVESAVPIAAAMIATGHRFDLIVIDPYPSESGDLIQLTDAVRKSGITAPLVILTGAATDEHTNTLSYPVKASFDKKSLNPYFFFQEIEGILSEESNEPSKQQRVLIVEDTEYWATLLSELLASQGFSVVVAAEVTVALTILEEQEIDLAVVDLVLDELQVKREGLSILEAIKIVSPMTSVVVVTAYELEDEVVRNILVDLGAYDFFSKRRFEPNKFLLTVAEIVDPPLFATIQSERDEGQHLKERRAFDLVIRLQSNRPHKSPVFRLPVRHDRLQKAPFVISLDPPDGVDVFPYVRQEVLPSSTGLTEVHFQIIALTSKMHRVRLVIEHEARTLVDEWFALETQ